MLAVVLHVFCSAYALMLVMLHHKFSWPTSAHGERGVGACSFCQVERTKRCSCELPQPHFLAAAAPLMTEH